MWYPLVYVLFFSGARPSELAALRVGDVDLERGTISITKSRDEHAEAAPKTEQSRREIPLLPNLVEVLRAVDHPRGATADTYFFRNPDGGPVTTTWWPKKSWIPVLKKLGIRRRKFYATRHTFISWALTSEMNLKALAEYVGTSVAMIEKSYGRYISDRGLAPLIRAVDPAADAAPIAPTGKKPGKSAARVGAGSRNGSVLREIRSGPRGNRTGRWTTSSTNDSADWLPTYTSSTDDGLVEDVAQNPSKKRETDPESGNGSRSGEGGEGAS